MSDTAWLFVAFAAVWVAIGIYLVTIHSRQKELERRLREMERERAR